MHISTAPKKLHQRICTLCFACVVFVIIPHVAFFHFLLPENFRIHFIQWIEREYENWGWMKKSKEREKICGCFHTWSILFFLLIIIFFSFQIRNDCQPVSANYCMCVSNCCMYTFRLHCISMPRWKGGGNGSIGFSFTCIPQAKKRRELSYNFPV